MEIVGLELSRIGLPLLVHDYHTSALAYVRRTPHSLILRELASELIAN